MAMSKESFSIVVWLLIIAAGISMLKLSGLNRLMVILALTLAAGIIHLFQPVLIQEVYKTGLFAVILVLLLWLGQWGFVKFPDLRKNAVLRRKKVMENRQKTEINKQADITTNQKSSPDDKKQLKQDQE
jgi:hypothetical protein